MIISTHDMKSIDYIARAKREVSFDLKRFGFESCPVTLISPDHWPVDASWLPVVPERPAEESREFMREFW